MEDQDRRQYERFARVYDFGTNAAEAATTDAPQNNAKLNVVIQAILKDHAGQQGGSAKPRAVLVEALQQDLILIHGAAVAIGQDVLGFETDFPMPKQRNASAILGSADQFITKLVDQQTDAPATQAAKLDRRTKLIAKGFAADFADKFAQHRADIGTNKDAENVADESAEENTSDIHTQVATGLALCNHLDATYRIVYRDNPGKLAAWTIANHCERAPVSAATKAKQAAKKAAKKTGTTPA